jgi:hypothetical protein
MIQPCSSRSSRRLTGTDAEGSARRDPVAYVALFMHAADDAGVFDTP